MPRLKNESLVFDTLRLEGGLFVPGILEKIAAGEHRLQSAEDYCLPRGLRLLDEQGRAFRIGRALWVRFGEHRARAGIDAARVTTGFVAEMLRDAFGYATLQPCPEAPVIGERAYPVSLMAAPHMPVVVAPHDLELDAPDERFAVRGSGSRRTSAHQLAQEYLNATDACTWAVVTNGRQWRLLRDADTLTRPNYLEIDLALILESERYPDFAAAWRILHASRAGSPETRDQAPWEQWRADGHAQGQRVRGAMRDGVTEALQTLGEAFLRQRDNEDLRRRLHAGDLTTDAYFQQLLRLVYRFLFLFTIEERGLLHPPGESPEARRAQALYAEGYSLRRLRARCLRRAGFDQHTDLWESVRIVFRGLAQGEARLALPALGGLFAPAQCPDLDAARLDNRALLTVMRQLRWSAVTGRLSAVDYRNMGPEELGSVYESLLELVPAVDLETRRFGFVGLTEDGSSGGNARKTTGSYYTPDSLVQELLDSALDPVIETRLAARPEDPEEALLSLAVVDPACGSGHFLLGAARRLAERLAALRAIDGAVRGGDYARALRDVIARCLYGVDRNPMALELARAALWLEGFEPGQPLSFLDHHLVCGDALLGLADLAALDHGIPKDAFKPLSGDSKTICRDLAAANRAALRAYVDRRAGDLFAAPDTTDLLDERRRLEAMPDHTPAEVAAKEAAHAAYLGHARRSRLAQAADLFVAAFLAPKATAEDAARCPTTETLADLLYPRRGATPDPAVLDHARALCAGARVLHWPLVFVEVFARGGFDCVLGNPPWERIKLQEQEFFASRDPRIAEARNKAERAQRIQWLAEGSLGHHLHGTDIPQGGDPAEIALHRAFLTARRVAEAMSVFAHVNGPDGGRFPLTGVGDVNTYALFAETNHAINHPGGRAGFIVPTGIATDDSTKAFFSHIVGAHRLASLFDFENREKLFEAVDSRMKFCLITLGPAEQARLAFFLLGTGDLADERRHFSLSPEDFALINPNTRTCPVFRSRADAELTKKIYRRVPVLIREAAAEAPEENPWGISFSAMIHMANDSGLFLDRPDAAPDALPLYEAKMMHQFDHRWATYAPEPGAPASPPEARDATLDEKQDPAFTVTPRYWVPEGEVLARIAPAPRAVLRAWQAADPEALLVACAHWVAAGLKEDPLAELGGHPLRQRVIDLGGARFAELPERESAWLDAKTLAEARQAPPLTPDECARLRTDTALGEAVHRILDARAPRWLMGWRDICRSTDERTVIASVVPRAGVGNKIPLFTFGQVGVFQACFLGNLNALVADFVARQKMGGTTLNYYLIKQFPILPPTAYDAASLAYIVPRVLELTFTAHDLRPWVKEVAAAYNEARPEAPLALPEAPFPFDPERRARLRAELDALYARLYGLERDDLRYILDPADTHGDDYPSQTFPGLKRNELRAHGEYRTQRLVLQAWDRLEDATN